MRDVILSDYISRQDAIGAIHCDIEITGTKNARIVAETIASFVDAIKALPSADRPKGEWIPVSERLPEYRKTVLISTYWGVRVAERDSVKEDSTDDFWYMYLDDATAHPRYVYAWMPLPEPYKGGDTE